jgi:hypothetical protein
MVSPSVTQSYGRRTSRNDITLETQAQMEVDDEVRGWVEFRCFYVHGNEPSDSTKSENVLTLCEHDTSSSKALHRGTSNQT